MVLEQLPKWYQDEPERGPYDWFYHRAFWRLTTERYIGSAIGPIQDHRITEYAERAGLDFAMMETFRTVMRKMDGAYLKWTNEQNKKTLSDKRVPGPPGKVRRPK